MVKLLDAAAERKIVQALKDAEAKTCGELRVHVKRGSAKDALEEAKRVFHKLGMHRTKGRSGVLIFVSWKSRSFAVLGDEGIHRKAGDVFDSTRDRMQEAFSRGKLADGIIAGVEAAGEALKRHFPRMADDKNELPDTITQGD